MTTPTFTSTITVDLIQHVGSDAMIAAAARVSTGRDLDDHTDKANAGLINYLVKNKHSSPLEHNSITFRVSAPIFVFREWHRHRIGFSYNEISARYTKLEPKFYVYPHERPLVQAGSSAHPELVAGDEGMAHKASVFIAQAYEASWFYYEHLLDQGVANEVARTVLPVGIFSEMYVTTNVRALLSFLSLRTSNEDAAFPSKPQYEIEVAAKLMEAHVAELFPVTYEAWNRLGRVSP